MGFPKIKDRRFSQSKNRVFFIAKTTQNELIAKPPLFVLPWKAQHCGSCTCVRLHQKNEKKRTPCSVCARTCQARRQQLDAQCKNKNIHKRKQKREARAPQPSFHLPARLIKPGGEKAPFVLELRRPYTNLLHRGPLIFQHFQIRIACKTLTLTPTAKG